MSKNKKQRQNNNKIGQTIINTFTGNLSINMRGIGFIPNPEKDQDDLEITKINLNTALPGDEVEVILKASKNPELPPTAIVNKIINRNSTQFVGTIHKNKNFLFFIPDNKKIYTDFYLKSSKHFPHVATGDKVLIGLKRWDDPTKNPEGEILQVFGKKGENNAEMHSIAADKGFDFEYPEKVIAEARQIEKNEKIIPREEIAKRRDFRSILTFTIDPETAKDFDDAISYQKLADNRHEIGVHIADVSHYVREHSELDKEAFKRQFSVYLVDRTIPMLPPVISDDLCSLNPNEDKLAFSAVFEINDEGKVLKRWFGKTIINSDKRFSYEKAQEAIKDPTAIYHQELSTLNRLAKTMLVARETKGAIDFEQDEVAFELDKNGVPTRIFLKTRLDAHKLVEEYMLLANREVAEYIWRINEKQAKKFPFLYRIHDLPSPEKIANLSLFVGALGYELNIVKDKNISSKDLQMLINEVAGKAESAIIKTAAIRSMAKAIYSTQNIGHFGLAFEYYTHFTSPIRRYPDLVVHRMLQKVLTGQTIAQYEWQHYEATAVRSTEKEIAAAEAERESKKYKQVEFMQNSIGETYEGVISGVTDWGIYVEEKETHCEGMVRLRSLPDDYYELDAKTYSLIGQKTKKVYRLGDKVKIRLVGADLERKTLDYEIF